ncbi:UNVERIFIED_CONTAM: hypothetical protein FKN15_051838 [Acipenser sinensis]
MQCCVINCCYKIVMPAAPSEPLLCKFADGGQKKRQNQSKYPQNGRSWPREGELFPLSGAVHMKNHRPDSALYLLLSIVGGKCTNCVEDESTKAKICIVSGIIFIIAGVLTMIPVCWSANTIIRDFYNPLLTDAQRRELGASLYIGWGAAGLLILGGVYGVGEHDKNINPYCFCASQTPLFVLTSRFYSSPYSIATNRMIAQTSITPFIAASPVSTYQVQSTSWMPHQSYVMQPTVTDLSHYQRVRLLHQYCTVYTVPWAPNRVYCTVGTMPCAPYHGYCTVFTYCSCAVQSAAPLFNLCCISIIKIGSLSNFLKLYSFFPTIVGKKEIKEIANRINFNDIPFPGSSAQELIPVVGSAEPIYLMCFLVPVAAEQPAFEVALSPLAKKASPCLEPLSFPILSPEATPQTTSPRCYDNASNGPHHVNAASQYDGSSRSTDESSVFGHNRNTLEKSPYMTAAAAASMQGTYIPQYTPVPPNAVPVEGVVTDASPQTLAPSSQDTSGQQQQIQVESTNEHAPAYSYQQSK